MVVVEEHLLLVAGPGDLDDLALGGQALHDLLRLGQRLVHVVEVHAALAVQVAPLQHLQKGLLVPQLEGSLELVPLVVSYLQNKDVGKQKWLPKQIEVTQI